MSATLKIMSDAKSAKGQVTFASRVFPTPEDMALWNSLSPTDQQAIIVRDIEQGLNSPSVSATSAELMQKALERRRRNAG